MSSHNQSHYLRPASDSSLITLIFLRKIYYTGCNKYMPNFEGDYEFVGRKMHKHLMKELKS